jgi:probable rRNA maturation factor
VEPPTEPGGRPEAGPVVADDDRGRPVYIGACRIDIVRRRGTLEGPPDASLARTVARALEAVGAPTPASVTLVLTDDAEITDLNRTHLGHDEPTDVLSFPMLPPESFPAHAGKAPAGARVAGGGRAGGRRRATVTGPATVRGGRIHLGDIAISVERAYEQAQSGHGGQTGDVRWSPFQELRLLATHGTLHLCGWDHAEPAEESAMRTLEQRLLAEERR